MQQHSITFVRVFDLIRVDRPSGRSTVGQRSTSFGFVDQTGRRCLVSIHGHPRVESGMSVIAILAIADKWQTLIGWVDQATGEIAGPEPINLPLVMVTIFTGGAGCISALVSDDLYWALAFGLATAGVGIWVWIGSRLYRKLSLLRPDATSQRL